MKYSEFDEILSQYEMWNGYSLFEENKDWFKKNSENGDLKIFLNDILLEINQIADFRKYDFVLLVIQAMEIDFSEKDDHFELIFKIADSITDDFEISVDGDEKSWLLHQLADVCIHRDDEVEIVSKKNPNLIPRILEKIGKVKYELNKDEYGPQMYFATYKAVGLLWYIPKEIAKGIIQEIYLKHFDKRVVDETKELIEYMKEEGDY